MASKVYENLSDIPMEEDPQKRGFYALLAILGDGKCDDGVTEKVMFWESKGVGDYYFGRDKENLNIIGTLDGGGKYYAEYGFVGVDQYGKPNRKDRADLRIQLDKEYNTMQKAGKFVEEDIVLRTGHKFIPMEPVVVLFDQENNVFGFIGADRYVAMHEKNKLNNHPEKE